MVQGAHGLWVEYADKSGEHGQSGATHVAQPVHFDGLVNPVVDLDGTELRAHDVATVARGGAEVRVPTAVGERLAAASDTARAPAGGPVYGRTTAVGANKHAA